MKFGTFHILSGRRDKTLKFGRMITVVLMNIIGVACENLSIIPFPGSIKNLKKSEVGALRPVERAKLHLPPEI